MIGIVAFTRKVLARARFEAWAAFHPEQGSLARQAVYSLRCLQKPLELGKTLQVCPEKPQVVMEIGSRYGGTLYCWSRIATRDAFILSLDWHRTDREDEMTRVLASRVLPTQEFHSIWGDSHSDPVKQAVRTKLQDKSVDLLFIDGDHSYEGVKEDFLNYSVYVRSGGAVLFHDIVPNHHYPDYGVDRFWRELSPGFEQKFEFVDSLHPGRGAGVGMIIMP